MDGLMTFLCIDCLATALLSYGVWTMIPQSESSREMRALTVFVTGMVAGPAVKFVMP